MQQQPGRVYMQTCPAISCEELQVRVDALSIMFAKALSSENRNGESDRSGNLISAGELHATNEHGRNCNCHLLGLSSVLTQHQGAHESEYKP
jgi:hypothetical protein